MNKYDFIESNPSRDYSDLNFSFTKHPVSDDVTKKTNEEAIKQALKSLVLLGRGEKPFHPEIGGGVYDLLFENMDEPGNEDYLKLRIEQVINAYEPRVELQGVQVENLYDQNAIAITIYFLIVNTLTPSSVDIFLKIAR